MDKYSCNVSSNPSFSSTLLEAIYRSIDEGEDEISVYRETMRKKQQSRLGLEDEEEMANLQKLRMIEKWMEKKGEKVVCRRRSLADFVPKARNNNNPQVFYSNSSWSSSDSSSGGGFSSSEAEDSGFSVTRNRSSSSSCYGLQKPKPIKTKIWGSKRSSASLRRPVEQSVRGLNHDDLEFRQRGLNHDDLEFRQRDEKVKQGGLEKTKSKALKIYGDLKKAKQPISPGGKLASFLNSMFSTMHEKTSKFAAEKNKKSKSANASTCSSTSSLSKSCLSKTPSSRSKLLSNGAKRSVRFYPIINVIVDQDCQPCGLKNLHEEKPNYESLKHVKSSINEELKIYNFEKNLQVEKAAKDFLRNYQKRVELDFDLRSIHHDKNEVFIEEVEEEFDDAISCSSSDLFELDNLSAVGMERYREELPVYETTHFDTNQAIANGMIL